MNGRFSPELKPPQKMPQIDPLKPAMAGMLKILCLTHRKQTAAFVPPEGISCRQAAVRSGSGAEIPCFILSPEEEKQGRPGILMIHGGGFYLPVQTSSLALASEYAKGLDALIFLPEYRLVPQFSAPAQLDDCEAVWNAMPEFGTDPEKRLVIGDSAGAALAAGLCLRLQKSGLTLPRGQLLIYPVLDDREERYSSYARCADACWSPEATRAMWKAYLKDVSSEQLQELVPGRCEEPGGLPPAYIEPQEIDVLRDEAVAFGEALQKAGVPVSLNLIEGSYHGFDADLSSPLVKRVIGARIAAAREMLGK